ncbi:MAG: protein translocase subunit SecD, partial [Candidatus Wolfebacteria bacterium]|nr:protein translocase subunit SecD [Candidatus Wolfebacteria bacterium]
LAIVVDGQVISSPKVSEQITGGNAVITGIKDANEAKNLANLLNAGALPAPVVLTSQSTIGATLGGAFLNKAIVAGALGTLLIILFISLYYRSLGILASIALIIYIILTLGVYKGGGVTMSLSGIAGFILSIGMAVDANVLIFERTKEEMKKGITFVSAIEEGFRRAWPSIRDSNTTTMITAVILYFTTSSFVQGFALTLGIGVLMSLFSSITVTRFLLRAFAKR